MLDVADPAKDDTAATREIAERVDVFFRARPAEVPLDHGYLLFSALEQALGGIHNAQWLAVHPLRGEALTSRTLAIGEFDHGTLGLRVEVAYVDQVLKLAGTVLRVGPARVRLGSSMIQRLVPARVLRARFVTIKGFVDAEPFREAIIRRLETLAIRGRVELGARGVMAVGGHLVVGYETILHDLDEDDSLRLLYTGLGGKQRMGAGIFIPQVKR